MRYVYPLDPECPVVAEFMETLFGDPMMAMGAPVEDITEEFERRHRKECKRCQEYGIRERLTESLPRLSSRHVSRRFAVRFWFCFRSRNSAKRAFVVNSMPLIFVCVVGLFFACLLLALLLWLL